MNRRYLLLIFTAYLMSGCLRADPMQTAVAQERTTGAAIAANQNAAQIHQAQQSDDEARRAQERLQALQAQQAATQALQGIAEANARQGIAESNNAALVKVADQIAEAAKPDNTVLIIVLIGAFALAGLVIWKLFSANAQLAQAATLAPAAQREQRERPALPAPNYIQIPAAVQLHADRLAGVAEWTGERWLIVDPNDGHTLAQQRLTTQCKQLKG